MDFIFPTYHAPPGAGSSVPGQAHIETGGVTSVFAFTTFAGTGESSGNTQEVSNRNQLILASGIVSSGSICNCFGAKPAGAEYTPAMAPGVISNTCGGAWTTLYKATVSGVASANYKIWTTGTDMNLDPYNGMCAFNAAAPLKIGLTVADGKDACTTAAPMGTDAEEGSGCAAGSFSGSQCVQSCPTHFLPSAGTGAPKCDDGAWIFPAATTATACYDTRFSPCSHTTCAVKNGHTVVRDWHSGEQNGNHHHCSSIVHADALNGSCQCECKSSFTESWIHHDTTGNKKSVSIASHIGAAKNDNENLPINRGADADKSRTATGHAYDTTTTTTTTTTTLAPTTTTTTTTATAAAATTTTAAAATTTTAAAATTTTAAAISAPIQQ